MFEMDLWLTVFNDDHRSANSTPVACNMHCMLMVIDIDTHKLADSSSPAQFAELVDKTIGVSGEANNSSIDIHHKSMWSIDLSSRGKADIWETVNLVNMPINLSAGLTLNP
jgi:hypothetical protein